MLHQLASEDWHLAQSLFDFEHHLVVAVAFAGEAPAELYVDDPLTPQAGILMLWNHRIYLAGTPTNSAFTSGLAALLQERYTPHSAEAEPMECVITYTPGSWEEHLPAGAAGIEAFRAERQHYCLQVHAPLPPPVLPAGFRLRQVDRALVAESVLTNHQALLDEMCSEAPSVDYFLQHRFGYCLQYEQELVGWCLSEYNHANCCELGIETLPAFQRRGLAMATASATIAHAYSQGITSIGWHCWKRNVASSNLAQKLGFEKVEDYPVWYCRFGKRRSA